MNENTNTVTETVPDRDDRDESQRVVVLDDVSFQRVSREIKNPAPPTAALVALFKLKK